MFRKHKKNSSRSDRDSGVASLASFHSVFEFNVSCPSFYQINELQQQEQKYVRMLEILVDEYQRHFLLARNPYHFSPVDLTNCRTMWGQDRKIFFFFQHFLSLHRTLCDLLEECQDSIEVGQVFVDWITEGNLEIYTKHWLLNPLRRTAVQDEFDKFMSRCVEHPEIAGVDAYIAPGIHLIFYKKTLMSLSEMCDAETNAVLQKALGCLNRFLEQHSQSADILDIVGCPANLEDIGHCLSRGDFQAREYVEGLKEKVTLYLFQRGLIVVTPKKCRKNQKVDNIFHSFCDLKHIDVSTTDPTIRLKDADTGRTYYRIKKKHTLLHKNKGMNISDIINTVCRLKEEEKLREFGSAYGECDEPPAEVINIPLVHRMRFKKFSLKHHGYTTHSMTSNLQENPKYVETFNIPCIEKFLREKPARTEELRQRLGDKMQQFLRFQELEKDRFDDLQSPNRASCDDFWTDDCDSGSHSNEDLDEDDFYSARESIEVV
ncbi:hypothetical protein DMENIID0001_048880 [Sergentomyia squamirostris]